MAAAALLLAAPASAHPFHPSAHPAKHVKRWQRHHRWVEKYRPFVYPSGRRFAVPWPIAACESGEDYFVGPYGAYGLILEPPWQSPREQDEDAHRLYEAYGEAPWAPFETGCSYR